MHTCRHTDIQSRETKTETKTQTVRHREAPDVQAGHKRHVRRRLQLRHVRGFVDMAGARWGNKRARRMQAHRPRQRVVRRDGLASPGESGAGGQLDAEHTESAAEKDPHRLLADGRRTAEVLHYDPGAPDGAQRRLLAAHGLADRGRPRLRQTKKTTKTDQDRRAPVDAWSANVMAVRAAERTAPSAMARLDAWARFLEPLALSPLRG